MRVAKWGNSLAVRLPGALVEALELREGDEVDIRPSKDGALEVVRKPDREELVLQLRKFRGLLPADFKFDREEANAR